MIKELVFATNNAHKIDEVTSLVNNKFNILSLEDIDFFDEIEENGFTFYDNASIKTSVIFNRFKIDCFADDSGLEIDALKGKPGVFSARYAGKHGDHDANMELVLDQLTGLKNRKARFKTVISLILNGVELFFEGAVEGVITTEKLGIGGFGYDPILKPDGFDQTFAEMDIDQKNKISHRAIAIKKMINYLAVVNCA